MFEERAEDIAVEGWGSAPKIQFCAERRQGGRPGTLRFTKRCEHMICRQHNACAAAFCKKPRLELLAMNDPLKMLDRNSPGEAYYSSLKIRSITNHFSPGFACGRTFWKRHINVSHSWTLGLSESAFRLASKEKCSFTSRIMNMRAPSR